MNHAPIKRSGMREHVRDLVVARILDGTYPAGTRLKELTLARECGVSQAPVREAFRELEASGLLESQHYRGTRVRTLDANGLREAYELRALIEERSAQLATPCPAQTLAQLRTTLARLRLAVRGTDIDEQTEAAIGFHRSLVAASGNGAFVAAWDALHWEVRSRVAFQRVRAAGGDPRQIVEANMETLRALEAGDGPRAGASARGVIERIIAGISAATRPAAPAKPVRKKPR